MKKELMKMEKQEIDDNLRNCENIYICIYDEEYIGLFKRIHWNTKPKKLVTGEYSYDAGNIYLGIDNDHIGMDKKHEYTFNKDNWEPIGTYVKYNRKKYISDCKIEKAISFDNLRLEMYSDGVINGYVPGIATSKELIDTLNYAYKYYNLNSDDKKQKRKLY